MKSTTVTNYDLSEGEPSEFEDVFDLDEESFEDENTEGEVEESDDDEDNFFRPLDEY